MNDRWSPLLPWQPLPYMVGGDIALQRSGCVEKHKLCNKEGRTDRRIKSRRKAFSPPFKHRSVERTDPEVTRHFH